MFSLTRKKERTKRQSLHCWECGCGKDAVGPVHFHGVVVRSSIFASSRFFISYSRVFALALPVFGSTIVKYSSRQA